MDRTLRTFAFLGGIAWAARFVIERPNPFEAGWTVQLVLLAPLVLVPLALPLLPAGSKPEHAVRRWVSRAHPIGVLSLILAFDRAPSILAAWLALPWLLTTGGIAIEALLRLRGEGVPFVARSPRELALAAGPILLPVGAGWALLACGGIRPLGFEDAIVLLTAAHFHYAGFLLPLFAGLHARARPGPAASLACLGVVAGVPLTALGITATQIGAGPVLETAAAVLTALAALLVASLHLRRASSGSHATSVRALLLLCGAALAFSSTLALAYGLRALTGWTQLDIPWMRALHGSANALGFGLAGTLAWTLQVRSRGSG